jgi:hypothetical protein
MHLSHHSSFSKSILAFIFLFLNGICIASPAIKNSVDNYTQTSTLQAGNDLNTLETTENHLPAQSIRHKGVRYSVVSLSNAGGKIDNNIADLDMQRSSQYSRHETYFQPRPGYYIFLFRYTLF